LTWPPIYTQVEVISLQKVEAAAEYCLDERGM
jgi:hypothetical protein